MSQHTIVLVDGREGGPMKTVKCIAVLFAMFLASANGQNNEFPVSSYGFLIEASAPVSQESIMERIPTHLRSLPWRFLPIDEQRPVYELTLERPIVLPPNIFWDASYAIAELGLVEFSGPLFLPLKENLKYRLYSSFSGFVHSGDGLFGSCSWTKNNKDTDSKHDCYPSSSDSFEWANERFLHFTKAWEFSGTRGKGVLIGQPDTGYSHHPEIIDNILIEKSLNFTNTKSEKKGALDPLNTLNGHGTSTASLIASPPGQQNYPYSPTHLKMYGPDSENAPFVEGVAPEGKIITYQVTNGSVVQVSFVRLSQAIHQAIKDNVGVVSICLGGPLPISSLHRTIRKASDQGIILVAAAGNYVPEFPFKKFVVWPARYSEVVAVASSDSNGQVWRHSSYGKQVDITAPGAGTWIASVRKSQQKQIFYEVQRGHGTSFSASYVAGSAALFLSHHGHDNLKKTYGPQNIGKLFQYMLKNHAYNRPTGWDTKRYGPGILDVYKLISAPLPDPQSFLPKRFSSPPTLALDAFVNFLPSQISKAHVKKTLKKLFRISSDSEIELSLNMFGDELKFHLTRNPILLEDFISLRKRQHSVPFSKRIQKFNPSQRFLAKLGLTPPPSL